MKLLAMLAFCPAVASLNLSVGRPSPPTFIEGKSANNRRQFISIAVAAVALPEMAWGSGGATAGKYTTIPIAKRRYYGRVQEGVHEFLLMGPAVVKGDIKSPLLLDFFDTSKVVVIEAKKQSINGQCTKKDKNCKGQEIRDSRYNDMKTSMYLLGNAFRINQTKAPDNLPSVRAAKSFFKQMDGLDKALKSKKKDALLVVKFYSAALDVLDEFLDLVELPPTSDKVYETPFDTRIGASSRIT